jgi:chaperonin GroES
LRLDALNNYLIIKLVDASDMTEGGVALPQRSLDKPRWAIVHSVGPGLPDANGRTHKPRVDPGDFIFVYRHGPVKVTTPHEDPHGDVLYAIHEGDVWLSLQIVGDEETKLLPQGNLVHIEPIVEERHKVSAGGIILPSAAEEKPDRARVLATGPGLRAENGGMVPIPLYPGDVVRYLPHALLEVTFTDLGDAKGKQFLVSYTDIVAVEREAAVPVELSAGAAA